MMDSFQDTNIVAYIHSFEVVRAIGAVADAFAFVEVYDPTNAVAFDPMELDLVDLNLWNKLGNPKINSYYSRYKKNIV